MRTSVMNSGIRAFAGTKVASRKDAPRSLSHCRWSACLVSAVLASASVASAQSGLVGWYQFENGTPGQIATSIVDSSQQIRNGTAAGGPIYTSDVHIQAACSGPANLASLRLNNPVAANQEVAFAGAFPFNTAGDATVTFWIKSPFSAHGAIIYGRIGFLEANYFHFFVNPDSTFGFNYRAPSGALHCLGYCSPSNGIPVSVNQWTHLAVVRQGNTYRAYKNGVLAATQVDANPDLPNFIGWGISARPGFRFNGLIDDLRLYSRALTPQEFFPDPVITQPVSAAACPTRDAQFSVTATGTGTFTYQWQIQDPVGGAWVNLTPSPLTLSCGGTATASATPANAGQVTIAVRPCPSEFLAMFQRRQVRCIVTNACGTAPSSEATYTICPADFNCSGGPPSLQDLFDFLAAYFANLPIADVNGTGGVSVDDVFVFLAAYFTGCS